MILQTLLFSAGAGTFPTGSLQPHSTDSHGIVYITTGSNPSFRSNLFMLLFKKPLAEPTAVCLLPLSPNATRYFLPTTRRGFSVPVEGNKVFESNVTYVWQYKVGKLCLDSMGVGEPPEVK